MAYPYPVSELEFRFHCIVQSEVEVIERSFQRPETFCFSNGKLKVSSLVKCKGEITFKNLPTF